MVFQTIFTVLMFSPFECAICPFSPAAGEKTVNTGFLSQEVRSEKDFRLSDLLTHDKLKNNHHYDTRR